MNSNMQQTVRPQNDTTIAQQQRDASQVLNKVLSPIEIRVEKAQMAFRNKPLLASFCNILERNLNVVLDQRTYVWGDQLRIDTNLVQSIEATHLTEEEKNHAVFWLMLFHTSYFALGFQNRLARLAEDQQPKYHAAFTQATLHQMQALHVDQPANADFWEDAGYVFQPLYALPQSARMEEEAYNALDAQATFIEQWTQVPPLHFVNLQAATGQNTQYSQQNHDAFAQEMLNDWVSEFAKVFDFGDTSFNGIRLLYFKANPPRDVSEAIMDCLRTKFPVADDLALYHNKKLANDYFAPKQADPIEEKTGHIELFIDCSGSITAGDIGNALKVFDDFFKKRKKKMTYGISCFDTSILSRIEVAEDEDPVEKVQKLAIIGGGGTDFRCVAHQIQTLKDADSKYRCDLAVVVTDMAGTFPDTVPCDFVWITSTQACNMQTVVNIAVPGTVIYL